MPKAFRHQQDTYLCLSKRVSTPSRHNPIDALIKPGILSLPGKAAHAKALCPAIIYCRLRRRLNRTCHKSPALPTPSTRSKSLSQAFPLPGTLLYIPTWHHEPDAFINYRIRRSEIRNSLLPTHGGLICNEVECFCLCLKCKRGYDKL